MDAVCGQRAILGYDDFAGAALPIRRQPGGAVEEQDRINRGFLATLHESRLGVREAGGPISDIGVHLVVGLMVSWSNYDRNLAIGLDLAIAHGRAGTDTIEVFNGDSITTFEELRLYIPNLEEQEAIQNPWVGVWMDGRPWYSFAGAAATAWLHSRYGVTTT